MGVPVLVPAARSEASGSVAFTRASLADPNQQPIREVSREEVKDAKKHLSESDFRFLQGAKNVSQGLETDDELLVIRGFENLGAEPREAGFFAHYNWVAELQLPAVVSERIAAVKLVMWLDRNRKKRQQRFVPAFYCPDLATGILVKGLLEVRFCPRCATPFFPTASNVLYCRTSCRDAHRIYRARWRKTQEEIKQQKARRKHAKKH
jgi:hypothetical protein